MAENGKLVNTTETMPSYSGISNPAHNDSDNVQLTQLTRRLTDSSNSLDDSPDVTSHSQEIPNNPSAPAGESDVFGLCCSASGHVPPARNDEKVDVVVFDGEVDDDGVDGNKKGHSALERQLGIEYSVTDVPPIHMCVLFGLQQVLLSISSTISIPLIVSGAICADDLTLVKSEIMSTFLFMCGVCTILQVLIGVRLPIIQGGCHKFIPAIAALMSLDIWKCPADMAPLLEAHQNGSSENITEVWQSRMREIQGGIMLASLAQVLIGCTGFLGILLEYLGPITIVPTISLVGLSLIDVALRFCEKHWGITALTVGLVFLFSLYLRNIRIPFPSCTRKKGCHIVRYPIFKLLPVHA